MALLRLASKETKRIALEGGDNDYIEVKTDVSKRDFNRLLQVIPNIEDGLTPATMSDFTDFLFDLLVVGWSLVDENGAPVPTTLENYNELSRDAALAVDAALVEHFNSLTPGDGERRKSA